MQKLSLSAGLAIVFAGICTPSFGTGTWVPETVLEDGARLVLETPEFFWELECKRIAQEFKPAEKRVIAPPLPDTSPENADILAREEFTSKTDVDEFTAAVKAGEVNVANAEEAIKHFTEVRKVLDGASEKFKTPLPAEEPSEFADYHEGAFAFKTRDTDKARASWERLLAQPAAERKHRTVWATYMLGKLALDDENYEEAVKRFKQTRELAKEGFADSLGLAADSYGWEALSELELGHAAQAARLYLTQLALGDASAVGSLKLLVPDRQVAVFGDTRDTQADVTTKKAYGVETVEAALDKAAADPLLRRIVTAHVLAIRVEQQWDGTDNKLKPDRQVHWLAAIEKAGVKDATDAEHLGWVAYSMGRYADAARWLKVSTGKSSAALWLKAKLALREGKVKDSATLYAEAVHLLPPDQTLENSMTMGDELMPVRSAFGEFGTVLLARSEFIKALDAFRDAGLREDAAYVAERCLTTKELLDYTQEHFPTEVPELTEKERESLNYEQQQAHDYGNVFRSLVARRLVREDNYKLARTFFLPPMQKVLDEYTAALAAGADEKKTKMVRARSLFHAAWIARYNGMELMGTIAGPDSGSNDGMTSAGDLAMVRLTGKTHVIEDEEEGANEAPKLVKFTLAVTPEEKKRLAATKLNPERRFHYRHVAAGLAWKAALLMPDGAEETADVLNSAGCWLKNKNEKAADRYYQAIERRCSKTEIGKEAVKLHWFPEVGGPWSDEETAREEAGKPKEPGGNGPGKE